MRWICPKCGHGGATFADAARAPLCDLCDYKVEMIPADEMKEEAKEEAMAIPTLEQRRHEEALRKAERETERARFLEQPHMRHLGVLGTCVTVHLNGGGKFTGFVSETDDPMFVTIIAQVGRAIGYFDKREIIGVTVYKNIEKD